MDDFFKRYKHYETFPIEQLKHIPEISFYNHNYYIANHSCNNSSDLLYVETDEYSEISEFYHVDGTRIIHIGFAYSSDKYITLQQEELS